MASPWGGAWAAAWGSSWGSVAQSWDAWGGSWSAHWGDSWGPTTAPATPAAAAQQSGGGRGKRRRPRQFLEIDGEIFEVADEREAIALLQEARRSAKEDAPAAAKKAIAAAVHAPAVAPAPKLVLSGFDSREAGAILARTQAQIGRIYLDAFRLELERQDEDDIETILSLL